MYIEFYGTRNMIDGTNTYSCINNNFFFPKKNMKQKRMKIDENKITANENIEHIWSM